MESSSAARRPRSLVRLIKILITIGAMALTSIGSFVLADAQPGAIAAPQPRGDHASAAMLAQSMWARLVAPGDDAEHSPCASAQPVR